MTRDPELDDQDDSPEPEPAVIAVVRLGSDVGSQGEQNALDQLEEDLDEALVAAGAEAGEFEGAELGGGECRLFFASDHPRATVAAIRPVIARSRFREGAKFVIAALDPDGVRRTRHEPL